MTCQNFDKAGEGETKLLLEGGQKRDQPKASLTNFFSQNFLVNLAQEKSI